MIWLFVSQHGRGGWRELGLRPISSNGLRSAIVAALGCIAVAAALDLLLEPFVGRALVFEPPGVDATGLNFASGAALLACGVLLGPFVEEMLFRGVLYAWLRRRIGVTFAAFVSAGIGAAFHLQLAAFFTTFFVFVVFAILYEGSGTLWASVVCHGSYNAAAFGWAIWGMRA